MDKYNPDCRSIVHSYVPIIQVPVFKKVAKLGPKQLNIGEFNSGICLRKLKGILKQIESLLMETLIYDDDKNLLVTVINNKNSIIAHKLKENIELVQNLCNMDRNYRRKRIRTHNVQIALSRGFYDCIDLTPITDQCERLEGDETLVELLAPLDKSYQNLYDVDFSSQLMQFEKEMINDAELDKLFLNTADSLRDVTHSSTEPQLCEPIKPEAERENKSPTVDDVDLQITINSILTDLAREDIESKDTDSVIFTNSFTGNELLRYKTKSINPIDNVFKHNMQQSWIKSP